MKQNLIVFEGVDGSGKSTQLSLFCRRLSAQDTPFHKLVFPQYQNPSSTLIRMYLEGDFGANPAEVNPYAASSFFAADRFASFVQVWKPIYESGTLIVSDRYTTSNAIHQAVKCPPVQREEFMHWLCDFEYEKMRLPEPNLVFYLDMPEEIARNLITLRGDEHKVARDIHEENDAYLAACRACGALAADVLGWKKISCADKNGNLRTPEDIHEEIWSQVQTYL